MILLLGGICGVILYGNEFAVREQLTIVPNRNVQPSQRSMADKRRAGLRTPRTSPARARSAAQIRSSFAQQLPTTLRPPSESFAWHATPENDGSNAIPDLNIDEFQSAADEIHGESLLDD